MGFTVDLYVNSSDKNVLSKDISRKKSYENCILKEQADILRLTIRINDTANLSGYNYAHVPRYGRYYYIEKIETTPNGFWELTMAVDPLMSFASQIKRCRGTLTRSERIFNGYLNDPEYKALAYQEVYTRKFPNSPDGNDELILITLG